MRQDVLDLRAFYATRLGRATRTIVGRKLTEAWGPASALDMLGLGYAAPYLEPFGSRARRTVAAMPAAQGVEVWPAQARNLSILVDEYALPFVNALFDRVLVIHALEEADDPVGLLREVWRVTAPSGRVIVAAANRVGFWSDAVATPFGHGRPYTRSQLESLVQEAGLEPLAWSRALFAPPLQWTARWAEGFEQVGPWLWPGLSGLILLEAVKSTFAVRPKGRRAPVRVFVPGALSPSPAGKSANATVPAAAGASTLGARPPRP